MPTAGDISKITLLSGNTYALKDETARESIADLSGGKTRILISSVTVNNQVMYTLTDSNGTQLTYQQIYDAYYSSKGAVFVFGSSVYTAADIYEGSVRLFMYYDADLYEFLFNVSSDNYYYSNNYSAGRVIFRSDQRVCLLIVQIDGTYYITSFDNPTTPLAASEVLEAYMSVYNVFFALPVDSSGEKFCVLQAVASDISHGKIIFEGIVYDEGLVWPVNRMLLWFYTDPNTGILQSSAFHSKIYPLSSKPAVPGGTDLSFVTTGEKYETTMLNGFGVFSAPAMTKRVPGGTEILNPLCIKRGAVQVGYAINVENSKLRVYFIFSCQQSGGVIFEHWMLYKQNPTGDPYEFTLENAPYKTQSSDASTYDQYRWSTSFSLNRDPKIVDLRLCMIIKDANGLEIDRIYSAQYRYTASLSNGTVTRVKVQTENTSEKDVVDIGLVVSDRINGAYNYSEISDITLMPFASSLLESGYSFFVPDEFFQDAPNGLQIVAVMGNGAHYGGPSFQMAEEDSSVRYDISQSLTSTQQETARTNIGAGSYSKPAGGIPDSDISSAATWNAKSDFSGAYADLTGKPDAVTYTQNSNVSVAGTTKTTYTYGQTAIYAPNGLIMGGTAAAAGLVTRGICGINSPTTGGACQKDNLYLNYDGDNTYRSNRQVVLQAGTTGTHYGSNLYQYCAARGDAVKGYVDGKVANFGMLPTPSASDNGKFIRVVDGAWTAVTVPNASGNSFGT